MATDDPIEEIKQRISITDVVGGYIPLKQAGRNLKALCPFHQEKTPSFTVNPDLGLYKCFGCGESGDIFSFVMKMEHCDFKEALETLANKANIELPKTTPKAKEKRGMKEKGYSLNADIAQAYHKLLFSSKGSVAKKYLINRGVSEESMQRFKLGFAPPLWDTITSKLSTTLIPLAVELGILIENAGKFYDRYRGRLMFPVYDPQGRCVGFSARLLDEYSDPNVQQGKYINSPQSFLFDKSSTLYGLHVAKDAIFSEDSAIMVEGNLDVVLLHQHGVKNTVAPLGTAVTKQHLTMLKKYSPSLMLSLDGDEAGKKALLRTIELCVSEEIIPEVIPLPQEEDPASLLAKGVIWQSIQEGKQDGYRYFLSQNIKKSKKHSPSERQRNLKVCLQFLKSIQSAPIQELYRKILAEMVGVSEASIARDLSLSSPPKINADEEVVEETDEEVHSADEIIFFNYLLQNPDSLSLLKNNITPADFSSNVCSELYEHIEKKIPLAELLTKVSEECKSFTELVLFTPEISIDTTTLLIMATGIKEKSLTRQLVQMKQDLESVEDPTSASLLLQSMVELKKVLESLKSKGIAEYG